MLQLSRHIETPRTTQKQLKEKYPDYTICGERSGWFYPVHATKTVLVSVGWPSLVADVRKHMVGNGVPVPENLATVMGEWHCREVSSENCTEMDPRVREAQQLHGQVQRFWNSLKNYVENGGEPVSQAEADRRAEICSRCPRREPEVALCAECWAKGLISSVLNRTQGWKSAHDAKLRGSMCGVCKCALTSKVHMPIIPEEAALFESQWPQEHDCWMKQDQSTAAIA